MGTPGVRASQSAPNGARPPAPGLPQPEICAGLCTTQAERDLNRDGAHTGRDNAQCQWGICPGRP